MSQIATQKDVSIGAVLNRSIPALKLALPKSMDPERMARIALTTIRRSADLLRCDANSVAGAVLEAASLGLEIDSRGLAYLVPFGREATLIPGYKGLMQLAYRSGKIANIYADVVFKAEVDAGKVSITLGAERGLRHDFDIIASAPMRMESKENPVVLAYAVAVFRDGFKHFEFVVEAEVKRRREASKASKNGFLWNKWIEEAWKKTAIRKLCKYMDLSPEMQRAIVLDEQADSESGKQSFDFASTIDVDFSSNIAADAENYDTAPFDAALTSFGVASDDRHLAAFIAAMAEKDRCPAEKVKAEAAGDMDNFIKVFRAWAAKNYPQAAEKQPAEPEAKPEAPAAVVTCPNRNGTIVRVAVECAKCKDRKDCPALSGPEE